MGRLPLHRALLVTHRQKEDSEILSFLLSPPAMNQATVQEWSRTKDIRLNLPIHVAIKRGADPTTIQKLIYMSQPSEGDEELFRDSDGNSPIHVALDSELPNKDVIGELLANELFHSMAMTVNKRGQYPIHVHLEHNVPRRELRTYLVEEQDTFLSNTILLSRDDDGYLPVHHLMVSSRKRQTPTSRFAEGVYELVKRMTELTVTSERNGILLEPISSPTSHDHEMLPLHLAFKYGWRYDVIEYLVRKDKSEKSLTFRDAAGKIPLHYACENNATGEHAIQKLLSNNVDRFEKQVMALDKYKRRPLWYAFTSGATRRKALETILKLDPNTVSPDESKEKQRSPRSPRSHNLPFGTLSESINDNTEVLCKLGFESIQGDEEIQNALHAIQGPNEIQWLFDQSRQSARCEAHFKETLLDALDSQTCIDFLNERSSDKRGIVKLVFFIYLHLGWIFLYIAATRMYLPAYHQDSQSINEPAIRLFSTGLCTLSMIFLGNEISQFSNVRTDNTIDRLVRYWLDPWNVLEVLTAVMIMITSIFIFWRQPAWNEDTVRVVLMTTATLLFAQSISFLRQTLLPFSKFVGGLIAVRYSAMMFDLGPILSCCRSSMSWFPFSLFQESFFLPLPCSTILIVLLSLMTSRRF